MFQAERRAHFAPLPIAHDLNPLDLSVRIDSFAQAGEPSMNLSLSALDQMTFPLLQTLLAGRDYAIARGVVMRLVDVPQDIRQRIKWADAGRLLEDDLMLV